MHRNFGYFPHKNIVKTTKIVDVHDGFQDKSDAKANAKTTVNPKPNDATCGSRKTNSTNKSYASSKEQHSSLYQVEKSPFEIMNTSEKLR